MAKQFEVQRYGGDQWRTVNFTIGGLPYCRGYVDAMDSLYPSPPYRVVELVGSDEIRVVQETTGRAAVHTNG
jgi:hypothetical protein